MKNRILPFTDEIILTSDQLEEFEQCFQLNSRSAWKTWFSEYIHYLSYCLKK